MVIKLSNEFLTILAGPQYSFIDAVSRAINDISNMTIAEFLKLYNTSGWLELASTDHILKLAYRSAGSVVYFDYLIVE